MNQPDIRTIVRESYATIARTGADCGCGTGGCCAPATDPAALARAIGYDSEELARILPEGANLGLSCGNPGAIARLQPGEVVLDLGSGAGFDAFLCGPKVGAAGRVIGVDMTPEMVARARANLVGYTARTGLRNIEFRLGEIEHLPLADASIDVVISNCVINLSPDKPQVWREIARVLKPGGRVAISDLVLLQPLPEAVVQAVDAYVGCIAGAVLVDDLQRMMRDAGLVGIALTPKPAYIEALMRADDPLYRKVQEALPAGTRLSDVITSMDIAAHKPGCSCAPGCC
ncbi:MAG: arsenite methyltransferase [Planctomycetota bacterium]|nr:arsenite methyltransferase [Planctomycetota bacterium]MDW8373830.1 arsenite methyltransferase [Planctomycetota bacterium]